MFHAALGGVMQVLLGREAILSLSRWWRGNAGPFDFRHNVSQRAQVPGRWKLATWQHVQESAAVLLFGPLQSFSTSVGTKIK